MNIYSQWLFQLKNKFEGSWANVLWMILPILLNFMVLNFISAKIFGSPETATNLNLLILLLCWGLFREITASATNLITFRWYHIRDFFFPLKRILQLEVLTQASVHLVLILFALMLKCFMYGETLSVISVSVALLNLLLFSYVFGALLFILGAFYRDAFHLWNNFLMLLFWAVPILYPVSKVPEQYLSFFKCNPLFLIFEQLTSALTGDFLLSPSSYVLLITGIVSSLFLQSILERFRNQVVLQL